MDLESPFSYSPFEMFTGAGGLFLCVVFVCLFSNASAIEEELTTKAAHQVENADLYWSGVQAYGQTIELTGSAPDFIARDEAEKLAASVWGVTDVDNLIRIIGEDDTCQHVFDTYLNREKVLFKSGKADVSPKSFDLISLLASAARKCGAKIEIAGHTDNKGEAKINLALSERRARSVKERLIASGVAAVQLTAIGYGDKQPIADNNDADGREKNRRIEFRVVGDAT